jgi:hypothetical protein
MSNYCPELFADLKAIANTPKVLQKLEAVEAEQAKAHATYKKRLEMKKYLSGIRKDAPTRILSMMNDIATALDGGDVSTIEELCWHRERNLIDLLGDMMVLCNETEVVPAKKNISTTGERVDRATILARASDPSNPDWSFCSRCSRPMRTSWIPYHQNNAMVCKEIKGGRSATLLTGTRIDSGEHIKHISLSLAGAIDSDDEDSNECLIDNYRNFGVMFQTPEGDEEDCGFFDTFKEAQIKFEEVVEQHRHTGANIVIFDSSNYNPESDNIGTVDIILEN